MHSLIFSEGKKIKNKYQNVWDFAQCYHHLVRRQNLEGWALVSHPCCCCSCKFCIHHQPTNPTILEQIPTKTKRKNQTLEVKKGRQRERRYTRDGGGGGGGEVVRRRRGERRRCTGAPIPFSILYFLFPQ